MARITPVDLGVDPDDLDDAFRVPYDERATPWKTAAPIIVP